MKIPDITGIVSIGRGALDPKKGQALEGKGAAAQTPDKVELSGESHILQKIALERPDEKARAELVSELKAAYQRGELDSDSLATAESRVQEGLFDDLIYGK
jgi:hypothetical protein